MNTSSNLRYIAAQVIMAVTEGRSLADCLEPALQPLNDPRDRAFVQALCYGVCRFYYRIDAVLAALLSKPMKAKDVDVHALLCVGLYQLMMMRVPPHAAVTETVNAVAALNKPWARGLVNAILRAYLREAERLMSAFDGDLEATYAHPDWWIGKLQRDWPDDWQHILEANNAHPPMSLRVNARLVTREAYLAQLPDATPIPETNTGIILSTPSPVEALPGFADGVVSVQDGAAQLATSLLNLAPGQRVLDACAAPGGKLTHILEVMPDVSAIVAVEKDRERLASIQENLQRLNMNAVCIHADAGDVTQWWDGQLFDRILLDAPCSASGVVRRHPDIKLLRQPTDLKALVKEQRYLLEKLWPLLQPGGVLVYATCSVFSEENVGVLSAFLAEHRDALENKIDATWGLACAIGRQILPGMHGMDGFYYAVLQKRGSSVSS